MTTDEVIDPDIEDLMDVTIEAAQGPLLISQPARVLSYNKEKQTARVQPLVSVLEVDWENETEDFVPLDPVSVPVAFPGSGAFSIVFNIEPGTDGVLVFADRDTTGWEATASGPKPPPSRERFNERHSFFIPEVRAPADPRDESAQDTSAGPTMHLDTNDSIQVGIATANKALALAEAVAAHVNAMASVFDTHTHTTTAPGAPTTPPISTPPPQAVLDALPPAPSPPVSVGMPTTTADDLGSERIKVDK